MLFPLQSRKQLFVIFINPVGNQHKLSLNTLIHRGGIITEYCSIMLYESLVSKQKKNKTNTFPEAASRALNPAVRFVLPDLELGTVFEENGNGNEEEEESEVKRGEEDSWNNTKHLPKRRHFVKVIMNIICQGQRIHCRNFSTFKSLL